MVTQRENTSPQVYARVAGASYITTIVLGVFGVNIVETRLLVAGNHAETVENILANDWLFRLGIASEILMYLLVILLSWALYLLLKPVNGNLALLALLWRAGEAIIGSGTTVISGLIPLLMLKAKTQFEVAELNALVGLFLDVRGAGLDFVLLFIGAGGTIFCYLLIKSKFVPRLLAYWGVVTYVSMFIISLVSILIADFPETLKMALFAPGGAFELIIGFWLLIKGINISQWNHYRAEPT